MTQTSNRGGQLVCWLFMAIGAAAVGAGVWTLIKSVRTGYWPVTGGVVRSAEIKRQSGDSRHGDTFSPALTYSYQVGGVDYTGDKIGVGQMSSSRHYAQGILNRYPIGKRVSVHYSPAAPAEAVLETGIHGGTWICFAVGTGFILFGVMFLQVQRASARAQVPGAPPAGVKALADGRRTMDKPPALMGVIFLLVGLGIFFLPPTGGTPSWILYAVGGMFGLGGIFLLLMRLKNKRYSKIALLPALALFLAIFHWVAFGKGERTGTVTTPFSAHNGVNVRTPFAICTIVVDVVIVAGAIHWLLKRRKG